MRRFIFFVIIMTVVMLLFVQTGLADDAFRPSLATGAQTLFATVLTVVIAALFIGVCGLLVLRAGRFEEGDRTWQILLLVVILAVALRVIVALAYKGYETDIGCFKGWAMGVYEYGPANFYTSGMFADYPPGYMYVLWVVGFFRALLGIEAGGALFTLMIKLPSIAAEVVTAIFAYKLASKQIGKMFGLLCASFLLFNPALFFNSSVWGQIDAFFILAAVVMLYFLQKDNPYLAALMFAVALLIKPQAIILAPVVGLYYLYALFKKGQIGRGVLGILSGAGIALTVFAAGVLPFMEEPTFAYTTNWVVEQYRGVVQSYPYATLNAFNLFALTGGNWISSNSPLWGLTYAHWGYIFIGLICVSVIILQWRSREQGRMFDLAAFLVVAVFMLAHSMHERYMLPACVFLLFAYIYTRDTATLLYAAAFSITMLLNQMITLYADSVVTAPLPTMVVSGINMALFIGFALHMAKRLFSGRVIIKAPAHHG